MRRSRSFYPTVILLWLYAFSGASAQVGFSNTQSETGSGRKNGILSRATIGINYATANEHLDEYDVSLYGMGFSGVFATGLFLFRNFAMHVEMFGTVLADPGIDVGDYEGTVDASFSALGFGGGVTYYIMPINVYLSQSVGAGVAELTTPQGSGGTDLGFAANTLIGKEWWIGDDWGLGLAGQFSIMLLPDEERLTVLGGGLLVSISFNPAGRPRPSRLRTESFDSDDLGQVDDKPVNHSTANEQSKIVGTSDGPRTSHPEQKINTAKPPASTLTPNTATPKRTLRGRGWAIDVPADWVDQPVEGAVLLHVREPTLRGSSFTTITLEVSLFMGNAESYRDKVVAERTETPIDQKPVIVGGLEGIEILVDLGGKPLKRSLQRVATDGGAGYLLSCSSDEVLFDSSRALCERVLDSFRFEQAGAQPGK